MGDEYFAAYEDLGVQRLMLSDTPRMAAFRAALEALDLKGKAVLDVGAGTGILSLFAARCGARRVYAVEASGLAAVLPEVIAANGFADVVTVFHCRVEDAVLPEKVDVLVSEWLGFHLLHESMLDSVVVARDAWLKPTGVMLPACARVFAAPVCLEQWAAKQFGFWSDVDGLDLSAFAPHAAQAALSAPLVTLLDASQLLAAPREVAVIDCSSVTLDDLAELGGSRLPFLAAATGVCHGYAIWFTVEFPECDCELSNAPGLPPTHWQQTVVLLPEMLAVAAGESRLDARIVLRKDAANPRECVIELELCDD